MVLCLGRQDVVLRELRPRDGDGGGRQEDGLERAELARRLRRGHPRQAGGVRRQPAPLAPHARQALGGPARLATARTLGVSGQVALLEVVGGSARGLAQRLAGIVGGALHAVGNGELLAHVVHVVITYWKNKAEKGQWAGTKEGRQSYLRPIIRNEGRPSLLR